MRKKIGVWWLSIGRKFVIRQWARIALGAFLGGILGLLVHLFVRDSTFAGLLAKKSADLTLVKDFDGITAYKNELLVVLLAIIGLLVLPILSRVGRLSRAWWAGIISGTTVAAAAITFSELIWYVSHPKRTGWLSLALLTAVLALEYWRQQTAPKHVPSKKIILDIPTAPIMSSKERVWNASSTDDPITDWEQDVIGRVAVVELLADHALRLRTPIVALHGGLGDGKSSVLNLLRKAVRRQAIVVSFSAWLPGSESTLATDLFGDIAAECRKHLYVPQLRKQVLTYARTISGSVSYLAGLKELLPGQSQREEIMELRETLSRVPTPIVILLDEIDRMQKDELLILLKILRGASSIPNVSFICAFSEEDVKKELSKDRPLASDYLEKFFPASINLAAPDPDLLAKLFQQRLKKGFEDQAWFKTPEEISKFSELLEQTWANGFSKTCTNLRKAGLLLNDILTASRPIVGEINPFDFIVIEAIRRFCPPVYHSVRKNPQLLTYGGNSLAKGARYLLEDEKKQKSAEYFKQLNGEIEQSSEPEAVRDLLSWIFPAFVNSFEKRTSYFAFTRPVNEVTAEEEKRICSADYFPIYFRSAVPEEMFSNTELERFLSTLAQAKTQSEIKVLFDQMLDAIPAKHPKREDFLWKLTRAFDRISATAAEYLAYAAADKAADYTYDLMNLGEAARALNIVFMAAQKLSDSPGAQRVLEGAMRLAADDTFAKRILEYTTAKDRNKVLTNFSNVDESKVKNAFISRMRQRYGPERPINQVKINQGDWQAFRVWVDNSKEDALIEQEFWRRFIDQNRKRLAQAINFIYPSNVYWSSDPKPIVENLFPLEQFKALLKNLAPSNDLDEVEMTALSRMSDLLKGIIPDPFSP